MPPVDPRMHRPAWLQVCDYIRHLISTGRLLPGQRLGAIDDLADEYETSPGTIRRALGALAAEELIVRRRGIPAEVAEPRERTMTRLQPGDRIRYRPATPDEQLEHDLAEGADVAEVTRASGKVEVYHPRAVEFEVAGE